VDLASRLRPLQSALRSRLSRADVLAEVIREVNSTLDPERVADAIVTRAAQWLPAAAWVVYAVDNAGVRTFGAHGLTATLEPAAVAMGQWVLKHGVVCAAKTCRGSPFGGGVSAAAFAFPLDAAGAPSGALVGLDKTPASARAPVRAGDAGRAAVGVGAGSHCAR
jgi:K+-sensing histidine kinase KdpD